MAKGILNERESDKNELLYVGMYNMFFHDCSNVLGW